MNRRLWIVLGVLPILSHVACADARDLEAAEEATPTIGEDQAGPSGATKADTDREALRDEVAALFDRYEKRHAIEELQASFAEKIPGARVRGIHYYEYAILRFGIPAFDLDRLKAGSVPYHAWGDLDCDQERDDVVLLDEPKPMVAVRFGDGRVLALEDRDGDVVSVGKAGEHLTAQAKGYGDQEPKEPMTFVAPCEFLHVFWWFKSSYALVYDQGRFREYGTSD